MPKIYGYCRVSTRWQSIKRQKENISATYPDAEFYSDAWTGTSMDRPSWNKLTRRVQPGDTIVFDAVDRMSRTAAEGVEQYMHLYDAGVNLVFLKQPHINTSVYRSALAQSVPMTGTAVDCILTGINDYFKALAAEQVRLAFQSAQTEVDNLHQRTSEGMRAANAGSKIAAARSGQTYITPKEKAAQEIIRKYSQDFAGNLPDSECMKLTGCSRNSFYKYKRNLIAAADAI